MNTLLTKKVSVFKQLAVCPIIHMHLRCKLKAGEHATFPFLEPPLHLKHAGKKAPNLSKKAKGIFTLQGGTLLRELLKGQSHYGEDASVSFVDDVIL